jgi:hypothetical protein
MPLLATRPEVLSAISVSPDGLSTLTAKLAGTFELADRDQTDAGVRGTGAECCERDDAERFSFSLS